MNNLPNGINKVSQPYYLKRKKQVLSKAELAVKPLILQGMTSKQVANKLFLSEKTIKFHLTRMYRLEGVKNRIEFIIKNMQAAA